MTTEVSARSVTRPYGADLEQPTTARLTALHFLMVPTHLGNAFALRVILVTHWIPLEFLAQCAKEVLTVRGVLQTILIGVLTVNTRQQGLEMYLHAFAQATLRAVPGPLTMIPVHVCQDSNQSLNPPWQDGDASRVDQMRFVSTTL